MKSETGTLDASAAVKSWVELYSDSMYSWAMHKTANKETAEDLVQDTFAAAITSFHKFKGESNAKTWLFGILNNKINDYYRNAYRRPQTQNGLDVNVLFDMEGRWRTGERPLEWDGDGSHLLDDEDFVASFQQCLGRLPENWFAVIQLKFIKGKKGKLICQELKITDTNLWQMLHRAKLQLRRCLEKNWFKQ